MKTKLNSLLCLIGISFLGLNAQTIIPPQFGELYLSQASAGVVTTGTAVIDMPNSRMAVEVWESFTAVELWWHNEAGTIAGWATVATGAHDPDVEFSASTNTFFVSYWAPNGFHLEQWQWNGSGYSLAVNHTISSSGSHPYWNNIDYTEGVGGAGTGIITWFDPASVLFPNSTIFARVFDENMNMGPVVAVSDGEAPDVAVCSDLDKFYISCIESGQVKVYSDTWSNLGIGIISSTPIQSVGTSAGEPRIATPHNLTGLLDAEDFTVVYSEAGQMIRGLSSDHSITPTAYTNYDISIGAGTSENKNPVVCYNKDRIKCLWSSDYTSGSTWTSSISSPKDLLLAELDPGNYANLYPNKYFEVNVNGSLPTTFDNVYPSIAETRTNNLGANTDYNHFLYPDNQGSIRCKWVYSLTTPKRLGNLDLEELTLVQYNDLYEVYGQDLTSYDFELVNIQGQKISGVNRLDISKDRMSVNTAGLNTGVYILHCISESDTRNFKLLIQ